MPALVSILFFWAQALPPPPPPPRTDTPLPPTSSRLGRREPLPLDLVTWIAPRSKFPNQGDDALSIISRLDASELALVRANSAESSVYQTAYEEVTQILRPKLGFPDGIYTLPTSNGDTLVARWPILEQIEGGPTVPSVWVWDRMGRTLVDDSCG